jgi:predicted ABC-type ATPase
MYMLAGPNGAGKSTLYELRIKPRIPSGDVPFINADIIQRDELKDASMEAAYTAAEIAETRRRSYLSEGKSFVSESTFSHESKLALTRQAKAAGFRVVIFHVNVRTADLSVERVAMRKTEGGHDVPENKIRERYARNQELIKQAVLAADHAFIYDNSTRNKPPALGLTFRNGKVIHVSELAPGWACDLYSKELEKFSPSLPEG